jgi:hypothetical protein
MNADRLRELLDYEPGSGIFRWRQRVARCVRVGDVAGYVHPSGYVFIKVDGTSYPAHRLAWLHVHGRWPNPHVDHRDGKRGRNALENLRECTVGENGQNLGVYRSNTSGETGVTRCGGKWRARIDLAGKQRHLGLFANAAEARAAYLAAKGVLHTFQPVPRAD